MLASSVFNDTVMVSVLLRYETTNGYNNNNYVLEIIISRVYHNIVIHYEINIGSIRSQNAMITL